MVRRPGGNLADYQIPFYQIMTFFKLINLITKNEWRFVAFLSLVLIFVTTLPLIFGWLVRPLNSQFTGIHFAMPIDWFVYYSYIEQARQGHFLFFDLFTSELHGATLNPFWLLVGLLAKYLNLTNIFAFNLVRIVLIPIFLVLAYLFVSLVFDELKKRKVTLLVLSFSSGAGFLLIDRLIRFPGNFVNGRLNWPMDLWVPELNTFATLYYSPHLIASYILIIFIFLLTILFVNNRKLVYSILVGLASLFLISFHPFHALTVFSVILVYLGLIILIKRKIIWLYILYYFIITLTSLPAIIYYAYLIKYDYVTRLKYIQNVCLTTPLWLTIFSLGLLFFFALWAVWLIYRKKVINSNIDLPPAFLSVWFLVQFGLLYTPVLFQRRLSEGLHFPLVVLSVIAWYYFYEQFLSEKSGLKKLIISQKIIIFVFGLVFLSLSNLLLISGDLYIYQNRKGFTYIEKDLIQAMDFLKNKKENFVVFNTSQNIVNIVPAFTGKTVYTGHGVETISFFEKQKEVDWFFRINRLESIEKDYLLKRRIGYIFYTDQEQRLGEYNPQAKDYLRLVFENSKVKIYQVE